MFRVGVVVIIVSVVGVTSIAFFVGVCTGVSVGSTIGESVIVSCFERIAIMVICVIVDNGGGTWTFRVVGVVNHRVTRSMRSLVYVVVFMISMIFGILIFRRLVTFMCIDIETGMQVDIFVAVKSRSTPDAELTAVGAPNVLRRAASLIRVA